MTENRYLETKVSDNGSEPVNLIEAKSYMNITSSDYDDLITDLIKVARKRVEDHTSLPLIQKDIILTADVVKPLRLPFCRIEGITSIEYLQGQNTDGTNDWLTLSLDDQDYQVIGEEYQIIYSNYTGIHRVTYTVNANTDERLLLTIKMITNWLFRNRLDEPAAMPESIFQHANPLKVMSWG